MVILLIVGIVLAWVAYLWIKFFYSLFKAIFVSLWLKFFASEKQVDEMFIKTVGPNYQKEKKEFDN